MLKKPYSIDLLMIVLGALVLRLAELPWAQVVQADAVSRIHIALEWKRSPHWITHGYWGPLHHYLNALFMALFPGKALGPTVLNILAASLTAIPLYGFTLKLFQSRQGAVFAALLYVLSPIVLWTSLQPLSEVPYGFFLAWSLYFLADRGSGRESYRASLVAGLFMTCAAALRYEAWVIIAAFSWVALLLRGWRHALVFGVCASLFPLVWMVGNQLEFGDALHSVNQNDEWNMGKEGINDDVSEATRIQRAIFFPWSFWLNASVICSALLLFGLLTAAIRKRLSRAQLVWLIPFAVMALIFQKKAWAGSLMLHHRFLVTWLILLLPFVALVFTVLRGRMLHRVIMPLGVLITIPAVLVFGKVDFIKLMGERDSARALDGLVLGHYREMQMVPRLHGSDTDELLSQVHMRANPGDGLILDFHSWDQSYYIMLHSPTNTMVVGGAKHEGFKADEARLLLAGHPQGLIVFSRTGMLRDLAELRGPVMRLKGLHVPLAVEGPIMLRGARLFSYRVVAPDDSLVAAADSLPPSMIVPATKDLEYYDHLIRSDEAWFASVRRQAFWKGESIDAALRRNAEWMMEQDRPQAQ